MESLKIKDFMKKFESENRKVEESEPLMEVCHTALASGTVSRVLSYYLKVVV